ncbi:PAS domain S-box protein [Bacillus songklensis]|uniref:histidine kinase n=1 Tax=Bacillus songklensis TaxID=1069116 RepID=A0ABV8AWN5_9BACI
MPMQKRKVLLLYIIGSIIWIIITEFLIRLLEMDIQSVLLFEKIKGIIYILLLGGFIYFVLNKKEEHTFSKQEEKRLLTLINSMVDFVNFKDGEGRWLEANDFALKLLQLEHVDYKGKKDCELAQYTEFYKDALNHCTVTDKRTWQNGELSRFEEHIPLPSGEIKIFDTIKVPLFNSNGSRQALVVIGRDITERKIAEKKLADSQQQYKSLFEYNPDLVYMVDLKGTITNLNPSFENVTGYQREEYIGKPILPLILEEDKEKVMESYYKLIDTGEPSLYEITIQHKNKRKVILSCTSVPMIINDKIIGIIGYCRDITVLRETEERLRKTEKLSIVGELAASVAHEIRNPLTSVKGFIQLLQQKNENDKTYHEIILTELDRINGIVSELLVLAKPQEITFKQSDAIQLLDNVKALLESQAHLHSVEMSVYVSDDIPAIDCEPNQLKQVFINVIMNAIEASSHGGKVSIKVSKKDEENVLISVEDNGCGIPEDRLKRLGEPFYSYKEKGTGLGLTVCYKIIEAHRGEISFTSQLGTGTTVDIVIPISHKSKKIAK